MTEKNIIISGVGGQGNILLEKVIGLGAIHGGFQVRAADTFGASQRGGSVLSHVRIGKHVASSLIPLCGADIIVGLEPRETLDTAVKYLRKDGLIIINTAIVLPAKVRSGEHRYPPLDMIIGLLTDLTRNVIVLDATRLAIQAAGTDKAMNVVMGGALIGTDALPIKPETIRKILKDTMRKTAETNLKAFDTGFEAVKELTESINN